MIAGCQPSNQADPQIEIARLRETVAEKEREIEARSATITELQTRVAAAVGLDQKRLSYLFVPDRVVIDSLSGGIDEDDKPGDEGVVVYVKPIDRHGDALKAAGEIHVQLFDLANPPEQSLVGELRMPVEKAADFWYGQFLTSHYTLKCPWKSGFPAHNEITIRVTFVNLFPPRVLTAQAVANVKLPS
ncbi:MAG: hypothetical protein JNG88_00905 [Phycisphaerales bacterium]|nr:hypothetical protein [Phycisphaerales bacterium]